MSFCFTFYMEKNYFGNAFVKLNEQLHFNFGMDSE